MVKVVPYAEVKDTISNEDLLIFTNIVPSQAPIWKRLEVPRCRPRNITRNFVVFNLSEYKELVSLNRDALALFNDEHDFDQINWEVSPKDFTFGQTAEFKSDTGRVIAYGNAMTRVNIKEGPALLNGPDLTLFDTRQTPIVVGGWRIGHPVWKQILEMIGLKQAIWFPDDQIKDLEKKGYDLIYVSTGPRMCQPDHYFGKGNHRFWVSQSQTDRQGKYWWSKWLNRDYIDWVPEISTANSKLVQADLDDNTQVVISEIFSINNDWTILARWLGKTHLIVADCKQAGELQLYNDQSLFVGRQGEDRSSVETLARMDFDFDQTTDVTLGHVKLWILQGNHIHKPTRKEEVPMTKDRVTLVICASHVDFDKFKDTKYYSKGDAYLLTEDFEPSDDLPIKDYFYVYFVSPTKITPYVEYMIRLGSVVGEWMHAATPIYVNGIYIYQVKKSSIAHFNKAPDNCVIDCRRSSGTGRDIRDSNEVANRNLAVNRMYRNRDVLKIAIDLIVDGELDLIKLAEELVDRFGYMHSVAHALVEQAKHDGVV